MDNSGMAFMENMKRLICDDRIVGYEYHCPINDIPGAPIGIYQSDSMEELLHPTNPSHIQAVTDGDQTMDYTSFNPGIKVGDEYYFSGDIFTYDSRYPTSRLLLKMGDMSSYFGDVYTRMFQFEKLCKTTGVPIKAYNVFYVLKNGKKIGNIYDGVDHG